MSHFTIFVCNRVTYDKFRIVPFPLTIEHIQVRAKQYNTECSLALNVVIHFPFPSVCILEIAVSVVLEKQVYKRCFCSSYETLIWFSVDLQMIVRYDLSDAGAQITFLSDHVMIES